jgi:hypothetical protein
MNKIKTLFMTSMMAIVAISGIFAIVAPQTALADNTSTTKTSETVSGNCDGKPGLFLIGFPAWYRGIMTEDTTNGCTVNNDLGISKIIWTVALNLLDIGILVVGYISIGYVIYGGFLLMTSRGKPEYISEGQMTIRNAVIGLVISFGSISLITFVLGGF